MRVLQDKDYRLFEKLVSLNEKQMVQAMTQLIKSKYDNVIATKEYIIATIPGNISNTEIAIYINLCFAIFNFIFLSSIN